MQSIDRAGLVPTSFRTLPRLKVVRAASIGEASQALAAAERPDVLAGGTDLPARFNEGRYPATLIDISRIAALREVRLESETLVIGALVNHFDGANHRLVRERLPGFAAGWATIANVRLRLAATIGGNLMARRTRYEAAILLSALGARLRLQTTAGEIEHAVADIWGDAIPARALLTAIVVPLKPGVVFDYERSLRPMMTQAVAVNAAGNGVVVTATEFAKPIVRRLDAGKPPTPDGSDLSFADPVTGDTYLRRASTVFLARQLARLSATKGA